MAPLFYWRVIMSKRIKLTKGDELTKSGVIYIGEADNRTSKHRYVTAKCFCGEMFDCLLTAFRSKTRPTNSCGCYHRKVASEFNTRHGKTCGGNQPIYRVWSNMKTRCYNPKSTAYDGYGGRGISVCDDWMKSSDSFIKWAESNGYKENLELDRRDNDGNYEPLNCHFVTPQINSRNKRVRYDSSTGISGVVIRKDNGKYRATINTDNKKAKALGTFSDFFEACCARKSAENRFWV